MRLPWLGRLAHASGISSIRTPWTRNAFLVDSDKADDEDVILQIALDQALRLFADASQRADQAITSLSNALADAQEDLARLKKDFEKSTITLSDGTKVYYDTETGRFERQDAQGTWHDLEDEDAIAEAHEKAKGNGGVASSKQGRIALERRQEQIGAGHVYMVSQQQRLETIDQAVESGRMSPEEGARQKQQVAQETEEYTQNFANDRRDLEQSIEPVAVQPQAEHRNQAESLLRETRAAQKETDEFKELFGAGDEAPNKGTDFESAGSALENVDWIAAAFEIAGKGRTLPENPEAAEPSKPDPLTPI